MNSALRTDSAEEPLKTPCFQGFLLKRNERSSAMDTPVRKYIFTLMERYPVLAHLQGEIEAGYSLIERAYSGGGKLLVAGNGGSSADAEHMVGELMKGFLLPRRCSDEMAAQLRAVDPGMGEVLSRNLQGALPAIALHGHYAFSTAFMNDCMPQLCFAQQVNGYGRPGDVFFGISTSGNSENVLYAAVTAKAKGRAVVGITGERESKLSVIVDVCIRVPGTEAFRVQEYHLPIYHCICMMLEERFFGGHE